MLVSRLVTRSGKAGLGKVRLGYKQGLRLVIKIR